ncbi:MAG: AAA family ATPase, partial [Solirubrobacterales bacterium]|nr:AAA family ATPase [Solirubrobacterales bacterium]
MIGRSDELALIVSLLNNVRHDGSALLLRGEAGIGKSVLLDAAVDRARASGFQVLYTAGVQTESGLPYSGLHRLLRPAVAGIESLPAREGSALRTAFGLRDGPPGDPLLVALATLELLSAQANDRPVLVVADDLHWLDPPSRDVLAFVGRRVRQEPIVVLTALRDGYQDEVGELGLPELALRGLAPDHAASLLDSRATGLSPIVRDRLLAEAAGNPLALVELPVTATADAAGTSAEGSLLPISARLERAFALRVRDLPAKTGTLLLIAAADERGTIAEIVTAARLLLDHPVSDASLDPAVAGGLIGLVADQVVFRHPLVSSAIYQSADFERRQAAHSALARVLVDDPDRRAWHRAEATLGRDDEVAQEVEDMAWRAHGRGSIMQAALLLGRAAELTADVDLRGQRLLKAAELAFQVGRADLVEGYVRDAQRLDLGSHDMARVELLSEVFYDGVAGDVDRVHSLAAIARRVSAEGDADLALELLKGASLRCWWSAMGPTVRAEVLGACDALSLHPCDPRLLAIVAIVAPIDREPDVSRGVAQSIETVSGNPPMAQLLAIAAHAVGDHDTAVRILVPVAEAMREHGRFGLLTQVQSMLQWDAIMLGEWSLAD